MNFIKNYFSILFKEDNGSLLVLSLVVFISRLPFLSAGYGAEEDSWGIALAAYNTHTTGVFEVSRFPGHPVQELLCSILWVDHPVVFNGLSAFFSTMATLFFALSLKHTRFKHYLFAAYSFAFMPAIYISSTYTIDYMWTAAFVMGGFYFLLKEKYILSGIFIGLAIGCRITAGAMLLPFAVIMWQQSDNKFFLKNILELYTAAVALGIITFIPVIMQYGWTFFDYSDTYPYPPITKVVYKGSIGAFGLIGLLAIILYGVIIIIRQIRDEQNQLLKNKFILAGLAVIFLYSVSYLRLPQKSAFIIPLVPFLILMYGLLLKSKEFKIFCSCLILSSFMFSVNLTDKYRGSASSKYSLKHTVSGQEIFLDPFTGPVYSDYSKRMQKMKFTDYIIDTCARLQNKTVLICNWWANELVVKMIGKKQNPNVIFEANLDETMMKSYLGKGCHIYYLPEQNIFNDLLFNIHTTNSFAAPFIADHQGSK